MNAPRWRSAEDDGTARILSCHNDRHLASREAFDRFGGCPYCIRAARAACIGAALAPALTNIAHALRRRAAQTDFSNENPRTVAAAGGMDKRS